MREVVQGFDLFVYVLWNFVIFGQNMRYVYFDFYLIIRKRKAVLFIVCCCEFELHCMVGSIIFRVLLLHVAQNCSLIHYGIFGSCAILI